MNIQFLGVGSFFSQKFYNTNVMIDGDLLVDCGWTIGRAMTKYSVDLPKSIFLTHAHGDHIGGIEEIAYRSLFFTNDSDFDKLAHNKIKLVAPLDVIDSLPSGFYLECAGRLPLSDFFEIISYGNDSIEFSHNSFVYTGIVTKHIRNMTSYGLLFNTDRGNTVWFSSDSKFNPEQLGTINADIIFHDCQFIGEPSVHAGISQLARLPEDIRKKMILMHYEDIGYDEIVMAEDIGFTIAKGGEIYCI